MTKVSKNNPVLSVVILNYNAGNFLVKCLQSINTSILNHQVEVVIADNDSTDNSFVDVQKINLNNKNIKYTFHKNTGNVGFSSGNNQAIKLINNCSKYVLFLNPDTTVENNTLDGMIRYFNQNPYVDAATCHIILASTGSLQQESHRNFPTPLISFLHFTGLSSRSYFMEYLDYSQVQKINACVGAFLMVKKSVGQKIGWWNEKYFFYGEDLDFCYKLKKGGYSLYFIPNYRITHYQGISSGLKKTKSPASRQTKIFSAKSSTNAMKIFYQENLMSGYPKIFHPIIFLGINILEVYRLFKAKYL